MLKMLKVRLRKRHFVAFLVQISLKFQSSAAATWQFNADAKELTNNKKYPIDILKAWLHTVNYTTNNLPLVGNILPQW